jgi:hypothetical protein
MQQQQQLLLSDGLSAAETNEKGKRRQLITTNDALNQLFNEPQG